MSNRCPCLKLLQSDSQHHTDQQPQPYPSYQHRCAARGRSGVVAPATQAYLCLTEKYSICPFFTPAAEQPAVEQPVTPPLAAGPAAPPRHVLQPFPWSQFGLIAIVALFLVTVIVIVLSSGLAGAPSSVALADANQGALLTTPAAAPTRSPLKAAFRVAFTATPTLTPSPTSTPTATPTPTATWTPTVTPTPTMTPTPVRPPADRPPDRIQIPSIKLDATIVPVEQKTMQVDGELVTTWAVADYAVSFHQNSAYPGHVGNTVLSGHNNINGEVFRYLADVAVGDEVILYVGERAYRYQVEETMILPDKSMTLEQRKENARWIDSFPDERLTMVTCWPYTGNSHRVIVVAKPLLEPALPGEPLAIGAEPLMQ